MDITRVVVLGATLTLVGCQSYERRPLELGEYLAELEARPAAAEERLASSGNDRAPGSFDLSDGISLAEAEVLTLFYHPELRAQRADAGVAMASAEHAGRWADPVFGFDAAQVLSPGSMFEWGAMLSFTLPVSGRLGILRDQAEAAHRVALAEVAAEEWEARFALRALWARWDHARRRLAMLDAALDRATGLEGVVSALMEQGEIPRVEGRLVSLRLVELRTRAIEAEWAATNARAAILAHMGLAPTSELELEQDSVTIDPAPMAPSPEELLDRSPRLWAARERYEVSEQALRLAVREQYPDITLGGGYGDEDDDRLLMGVSLPIPVINANREGIARARAERERARVEAELAVGALLRELDEAKRRSRTIGAQRAVFDQTAMEMIETQRQELTQLAQLGEIGPLVVVSALDTELDVRERLLELELEFTIALIDMQRLIGPPSTTQTPTSPVENQLPEGDER